MRTPIIAGNWKMHKTVAEAIQLAHAVCDAVVDINGVDVALCPPFTALGAVKNIVEDSCNTFPWILVKPENVRQDGYISLLNMGKYSGIKCEGILPDRVCEGCCYLTE